MLHRDTHVVSPGGGRGEPTAITGGILGIPPVCGDHRERWGQQKPFLISETLFTLTSLQRRQNLSQFSSRTPLREDTLDSTFLGKQSQLVGLPTEQADCSLNYQLLIWVMIQAAKWLLSPSGMETETCLSILYS